MPDNICFREKYIDNNHQASGGMYINNAGEQILLSTSQKHFIEIANKLDNKEDFMQKMILQAMQELQNQKKD